MNVDENWRLLVKSVDGTEIISVTELPRREETDILVTCTSGKKHLLRKESQQVSLLRQKWGYEQLTRNGLPCPEVERYVPPTADYPQGCLVISWLDGIPAGEIIEREGTGKTSYHLCREMGRLLRGLHETPVTGPVPDYIFSSTRNDAHNFAIHCAGTLKDASLVDERFVSLFMRLVEPYIERIPHPAPQNLCFSDMHFSNVLFYDEHPPRIAGFVDVEEIGVGWPLWDFTNWECWGIRFFGNWTRQHILQGYGPVDMDMLRMAVLVRLARPVTFTGSTRQQIQRAVEEQDISAFDLNALYK
jgi:aminoglycoside phosphotransferase (APT) family kinase protein